MISIRVDTRAFNRTLREYATAIRKDGDEVVNRTAMHVAFQAVSHTRHADIAKIAALKEVAAVQITGKSGKMLKSFSQVSAKTQEKRKTYKATTLAVMYKLAALHRQGVNVRSRFKSRAEIEDAALAMVNARLRSVNYLRSGWLAAAKSLEMVVRQVPAGYRKLKLRAKILRMNQGGAIVSTGGRASASIFNNSLYSYKEKGVSPKLVQYAAEGLRAAMAQSSAFMRGVIQERLAKAAERANRK